MVKFLKKLKQNEVLVKCESIINKYFASDKPSNILSDKMKYATVLYKQCIPTVGSLDIPPTKQIVLVLRDPVKENGVVSTS